MYPDDHERIVWEDTKDPMSRRAMRPTLFLTIARLIVLSTHFTLQDGYVSEHCAEELVARISTPQVTKSVQPSS
jgi:hypothetical protein